LSRRWQAVFVPGYDRRWGEAILFTCTSIVSLASFV
jgi:hypothetical protein